MADDRKHQRLNLLIEQEMDHDTELLPIGEDPGERMRHYASLGFYELAADMASTLGDKEREETYTKAYKAIIHQY